MISDLDGEAKNVCVSHVRDTKGGALSSLPTYLYDRCQID